MAVPFPLHHFIGGGGNRGGKTRLEFAGFAVDFRSGAFDQRQRVDDSDRHGLPADREVLQRALCLRAPIAVPGDVDRAERIAFTSNCGLIGRCHRLKPLKGSKRQSASGKSARARRDQSLPVREKRCPASIGSRLVCQSESWPNSKLEEIRRSSASLL